MCGSDGLSSSSSLLICGKSCRCQAENPLNALPSFTRPALVVVAGKQYLFGGLRPSDERQKHRNRARAELHFRRAEPRAGRSNGDVASKRQFERSADAIAM